MAGGKVTVRQKMINMMYLVLTAMLALNVSAEILRAFHAMEVSMQATGKNIDLKNNDVMAQFEKAMEVSPEKTRPYKEKADNARKISKELITYIEGLKKQFIDITGGYEENGQLKGEKDMEEHTRILVNEKKGDELMEKINSTRTKLQNLLDESDKAAFKSNLKAEKPADALPEQSWASYSFENTPLAAVVAKLTMIQNDCRNTEADVLNKLAASISKKDFKFDQLQAAVVAPSSTVTTGQEYTAEIFLSAFNSKQESEIYVNGQRLKSENGKGVYKVVPTQQGVFKYTGKIVINDPETGQPKDYNFEQEYQVFQPAATISAEKMNVLYAGLDNPIAISVPGFPPDKIRASATNMKLTGANGKYISRVEMGATRECMVNVSVEMPDKSVKSVGGMKFRIRPVPTPIATIGGKDGGTVTKAEMSAYQAIQVGLGPAFAFDGLNYTVTKYSVAYKPKRGDGTVIPCTGSAFTPQIKSIFSRLAPGDMIIFFALEATCPQVAGIKKINQGPVFTVQ